MAVADHPVLTALCDQVARQVYHPRVCIPYACCKSSALARLSTLPSPPILQASAQFHDEHTTLDTLERTGPGPFSDAVMTHNASAEMQAIRMRGGPREAAARSGGSVSAMLGFGGFGMRALGSRPTTREKPEWSLTILPVTAFGLKFEQLRLSERQMQMDPNVYAVHFDGSWKPIRVDRGLALARARERTQLRGYKTHPIGDARGCGERGKQSHAQCMRTPAIENSMKTNVARAMRNNVAEPHGWTMR